MGLSYPWGMAFLPGGEILVTERPGRLRVIRDGVLEPEPISGGPYGREGEWVSPGCWTSPSISRPKMLSASEAREPDARGVDASFAAGDRGPYQP